MVLLLNIVRSPHIRQALMISLIFWVGVILMIHSNNESQYVRYWMSRTWMRNQVLIESSNVINLSVTANEIKPTCLNQVNISEPTTLVINETVLPPEELDRLFPHIRTGGHWEPEDCLAQQKLGIFIPLRGRWHHLPILLRHLHQLLVSQQCHYTFYVIEQGDENPFNRGKLFNVGVIEALKLEPELDCFILHDVDTLPETNLAIYKCHNDSRLALEMATYQKKKKYKQVYDGYAGGVLAIHRAQYEKINGFSNEYWGWGFKDDELTARLRKKGYDVVQERSRGGYFYSLDHAQAKANPNRIKVGRKHQSTTLFNEGLNSTDYVLMKMEKKRLFTSFKVNTTITVP